MEQIRTGHERDINTEMNVEKDMEMDVCKDVVMELEHTSKDACKHQNN